MVRARPGPFRTTILRVRVRRRARQIQNNTVGTTQFGIVTVSSSEYGSTRNNLQGLGDKTTIQNNIVMNTEIFDAIDVCSNNNNVKGNTILNSTESGIHLDSTCGSTGNNNQVSGNTINEACAGILVGGTGNNTGGNTFFNDVSSTLAGDVCPVPAAGAGASVRVLQNRNRTGSARPVPVH